MRSSQQVLANKISFPLLSSRILSPSTFLNCLQRTERALSVPIPQVTLMIDTPKSYTYLSPTVLTSLDRTSRAAKPSANIYHIDKKCPPSMCTY